MRDFELLLHFNILTALTISSRDPANNAIWTTSVPQIALGHPFLMHGILGLSALHLPRLNPDKHQEYAILAAKQENTAFPPVPRRSGQSH
ncbi:hypothetical protein OCU04_012629 [Sclerotinia nivalis]|uniref:Uncharacterized protein n=1 Tax=Sclerotinia nivalis TaxID=352851 RepID=A0A9X0DDG0_9HELO|nr:hypothetical protein OCU04_012629 [Sclerotinia nivalis]